MTRKTSLSTLATRWQRGDHRTDGELVRQIRTLVLRRMRRVLFHRGVERDNPDDHRDILHEGVLAAINALRKWRRGAGTKPVREFIRPEVDRAIRKAIKFTRPLPRTGVSSRSPEHAIISALSLQAAAWSLHPTTRKVIRWCLLDPIPATTRHAALALGLSEATVKRHLKRGSAALRDILSGP